LAGKASGIIITRATVEITVALVIVEIKGFSKANHFSGSIDGYAVKRFSKKHHQQLQYNNPPTSISLSIV